MFFGEFLRMAPHGGVPRPHTSPLLGAVISGSPSDLRVNRLQNANGFRVSPTSVPVKDHTSGRNQLKGGTGIVQVPVPLFLFKGDQT